ncbi:hypothetical protein TNCV_2280791 [Trichonephila clavipes]|nr:hypothetical protein TNCV_2280791 [Trichonephila clavipes]
MVTDRLSETYTKSLLNIPNGDLVAVKINASNVQTNGQGIKESKREVAFTCVFKNRILYSNRRGRPHIEGGLIPELDEEVDRVDEDSIGVNILFVEESMALGIGG